jgi:hypothetical protein
VISVSGEPFSRRTCSASAIAESFIVVDEDASKSYTRRADAGRDSWRAPGKEGQTPLRMILKSSAAANFNGPSAAWATLLCVTVEPLMKPDPAIVSACDVEPAAC